MPRSLRVIAFALLAAWAVPAAASSITITRDKWGVPHVFVPKTLGGTIAQLKALGFAQGYAEAEDRMVQLEFFRRAAKGHLSDVLGPSFLPMDIEARRDGLTETELSAAVKHLRGRQRIALNAFADGVNQFIADMTADASKKPAELVLLGISPAPWSVTDTAAIAQLEIRRFGQNGGDELTNAVTLLDLMDNFSTADAEGIFNDLFWLEDPTAPTTISPAEQTVAPLPLTRFSAAQMQLITQYATDIRGAAVALGDERTMLASLAPRIGIPYEFPQTASNAMVVSGGLTASTHPILLGGPQVGLDLPSFFYEIGLHGGGYDTEGVTVPGGTGLVIGRTANMAWTITSGITDNTDVYVEKLNPANPQQYFFNGSYVPMSCRNETFTPSGAPVQTVQVCRTIHGPVFASYPADNVAFSRKLYFFGGETEAGATLLSLGTTTSLKRFERTIDKLKASLNCMFADTSGNIAYFHRGLRIERPSTMDPRLPLPGTGEAEPVRVLSGRRMPTAINPAQGFIAQWNNKPIQGWSADEQRELWGGVDRVQVLIDQIAAAKAAHHLITPSDVAGYMKVAATADQFAPRTLPYLDAAIAGLPPSTPDRAALSTAGAFIDAWVAAGAPLVADSSGKIPYPGVTIYRAWRQQVQADTFGDELGSHVRTMNYFQTSTGDNEDDSGSLFSPDALFLRALAGPSAAFPLSRDYFENVTTSTNPGRDATLIGSLRTAIAALGTQFGTADQSQWLTPKITVTFDASASAAAIFYGPTTIEREDRGSFNEVLEMDATPVGQIIVPPGESGFLPLPLPASPPPHLRDQVADYESFTYRPMPFALGDLEGPTTSEVLTLP
ncbi:MAG TPA: penicillin acylase family protein [Candidatus Binatia bacterium]|nr:penicillin acylase family protein [Candidatus Binatia bacterium]